MKKIRPYFEDLVAPFLIALSIQFSVSMVTIYSYVFYQIIKGVIGNLDNSGIDASTEKIINSVISNTTLTIGISVCASLICLLVFGIWYKKLGGRIDKESIKQNFTLKKIFGIVILGVGLQISINFLLSLIAALKPEWFNNYTQLMESLNLENSSLALLYAAVIAPISEEMIFRGLMIKKGRKSLPFIVVNIIQAILFGVYHLNVIQGLYAAFLGIFLGIACYEMKSVFGAILLHMTFNISSLVLNFINTESLTENGLYVLVLFIASIVAVVFGTVVLREKQEVDIDLY